MKTSSSCKPQLKLGFEQFALTADKFHSFAHLTNQHLQELNDAVITQATFSYRNQRHTNAAITYLLHLIMQLTQYTDGAQNLLTLENQIRQLIEGQLPRSLISVETSRRHSYKYHGTFGKIQRAPVSCRFFTAGRL
jgi:hypothetical protein